MPKKIAVVLTLSALPLVFFASSWLGGVALVQGDGWAANLGLRILTGRLLREGELPLWNAYIFGGMPLLASVYPGVLYPFNWIFAVLSPGLAMQIVVVTTYHVAIIGAYCYARSLGATRLASVVTGVVFAFGGYMVMAIGQTSNIATAAWLPWIVLSIERLSQSEGWRSRWFWIVSGAFAIALQVFAGVPQVVWYTALVCGVYSVFIVATRSRKWQFLLGAVVMSGCGALLAAAQLLPLRELQVQGGRAAISYETFASYSFPPRQVFALIFPFFFGGAAMAPYHVPYWGEWGIYATCGYSGLLGLMLAIAAYARPQRNLVWFWVVIAGASLLLSFGDYLPFGLNRWLYAVPFYNLFRASFRHMLEFNFAIAVLAGLGLTALVQTEKERALRIAWLSSAVLIALVAITAGAYLFMQSVMPETPRPAGSNSITNPEAWIPVLITVLSVAVLLAYARFRSSWWGAVLLLVLLGDLAAYGQFLEWRTMKFSVNEELRVDPPTVQFIKAREAVTPGFRVLSHSSNPYGANYTLLNFPNVSIARGLQSVNGYDMLQMSRPAQLMGDMSPHGLVRRLSSFGVTDQAFNLLNVKYLLWEKSPPTGTVSVGGVGFADGSLELALSRGEKANLDFAGTAANELAIISTLSNSSAVPEAAPVVRVSIQTRDGRRLERDIQAGRDTSEWAFDHPDTRRNIKHARAVIAESWPADGFSGHRYLARIGFDRATIERVELTYVRDDAEIAITRVSLHDSLSGRSTPADYRPLPPERWRKLATFGGVDVYENEMAMPRAWFVTRLTSKSDSDALHAIQGAKQGGAHFDPGEVAFLTQDDVENAPLPLAPIEREAHATVTISSYESRRIQLDTRRKAAGFLVLSEIYYPGWEARIDGELTKVFRTDYALRGVIVPSGEHRVVFTFRHPSFKLGVFLVGIGATVLLLGGVWLGLIGPRLRR